MIIQWVETNYSIQWCHENYIQPRSMKRARDVRDQLTALCARVDIPLMSLDDARDSIPYRKAITAGFFYNTAQLGRNGDSYRTAKQKQTVLVHPSSSLFKELRKWVVYYELVFTSREYMRMASEIQPEW
jgi:pre-mRNA-splicing factor ATP-dependent RNA helicase DHX16